MCFGLSTLGAGAKTRLESRLKEFTPHCVCRPWVMKSHRTAPSSPNFNFSPVGPTFSVIWRSLSYHVSYSVQLPRNVVHVVKTNEGMRKYGAQAPTSLYQDFAPHTPKAVTYTLFFATFPFIRCSLASLVCYSMHIPIRPRLWPISYFLPHFRCYDVVSLHMFFLPHVRCYDVDSLHMYGLPYKYPYAHGCDLP